MNFKLPLKTLTLLSASSLFADDWPAFRGPEGNGFSAETDVSATLKQSWKVDLPGRGLSSPIVIGHLTFLRFSLALQLTIPTSWILLVCISISSYLPIKIWARQNCIYSYVGYFQL